MPGNAFATSLRDADNPPLAVRDTWSSHPKCVPHCHLQTTTHSRRYVTHSDHYYTQFSCYAPRGSGCKDRPQRERTQPISVSSPTAAVPCGPAVTSPRPIDDEHNTDNNFLLLFADVGITPTLLEGLSEVDVLHIALGCRFALDIFTNSQQYSLTPDQETLPLGSELVLLL